MLISLCEAPAAASGWRTAISSTGGLLRLNKWMTRLHSGAAALHEPGDQSHTDEHGRRQRHPRRGAEPIED